MEHVYTYAPEKAQSVGFAWQPYLGLFLFVFGVSLMGAAGFWRWQASRSATEIQLASHESLNNQAPEKTALSNLTEKNELGSPANQAVAGAENSADNSGQTGFGLVSAKTCGETVFQIGEKEKSPLDHPADEFNWVGALDVLPDYADPFVVGENSNTDFPWRTSLNDRGEIVNRIQFNAQTQISGELTLGWLPSSGGQVSKLVYLDDQLVGSTPTITGEFSPGTWQNMKARQDEVSFSISPGTHILTIASIEGGSEPSVWDFLQLKSGCN